MRVLSASESISPAIDRAKALLQPFSLKLWLKLGLVAILAEMGGQLAFPPIGNFHPQASHTASTFAASPSISAALGGVTLILLIVFFSIGLLIWFALFYLGSRMQLVLMDLVATRTTWVAPAWHRTASRTWRWIGLKIVFFLAVFATLAIILTVPIIHLIRSMPSGNTQPTAAFFGTFALLFIVFFCAIIIVVVAIWFLRDLVLPFILFEDAPIGTAFRSATSILRRDTGSVFFYFFMKLVLSFAVGIAAELCIALAVLIIGIPTGGIGAVLWYALHQGSPATIAIMYASFVLLAIVFLALFVCVILCIAGAILIFYQAYALYFLGGRYPQLGNLLEPPPPPPAEPPPLLSPS